MTDRQMAEKKKEFENLLLSKKLIEVEDMANGIKKGLFVELDGLENMYWDFIEKLVEEVERKTLIEGWTIGYELGLEKTDKTN